MCAGCATNQFVVCWLNFLMSVFGAYWYLLSPLELPTFMSNSTSKLFIHVIALVSSSIQGQAESSHPVDGL